MANELFNSKEYTRNPRNKGWMLLKRKADGTIFALADTTTISVGWCTTHGIMWPNPNAPQSYSKDCKKWDSWDPLDEIFVVRVHSEKCPIEVNFKEEAPRVNKGNVLFKVKEN